MPNNEVTFELIDAEVKKLNLKDFETGGKHHFTAAVVAANPASVLQSVCAIYHRIKGILTAIANFPLLPGSWRAAIKTFISLMNNLCP
ncbi:MAG: hypothetical protein ABIU77_24420 [Ferruginibacter sp.]